MATCLNISDKLKRDKKQIQIGDLILTVNTSFDAMVEIEALKKQSEGFDATVLEKSLKILLQGDYDKFKKLGLDVEDTIVVFTAIMAILSGETFEEADARFQNEGNDK